MSEAGPIGRSMKRVEDPRLLRGEGRFVDDITTPLHVAFVRSPLASGHLRSIDAAASRVTVFTAAWMRRAIHARRISSG